jgi:hypothetical protein
MTDFFFFSASKGLSPVSLKKVPGIGGVIKGSVLLTALRFAADSGATPTARPTLGLLHEGS